MFTESGNDEIDVHLRRHVHEPPPQAVVRENEEHLPQDGPDVLQLVVLKVLQHEGGHSGDDADEEVGAGEGDEGRGGDGEEEAGRVHQRDGGEASWKERKNIYLLYQFYINITLSFIF